MKKTKKVGLGIAVITSAIGVAFAAHKKLKKIEKAELMDTSQWDDEEIKYSNSGKKHD